MEEKPKKLYRAQPHSPWDMALDTSSHPWLL